MAISLKRRNEGTKAKPDAMTLVEHLAELRRRVMVSAAAFIVAATVAFIAYNPILSFLREPYCQAMHQHCSFYITGPLDGLTLR
ncbi:MAG: twin-arginine translocase subunit TatC, partial [Acidimicrobiales bacterium]